MCDFFSFVTYKDKKYFPDAAQRKEMRDNLQDPDSHSHIISEILKGNRLAQDRCNSYEVTSNGGVDVDSVREDDDQIPVEDLEHWFKGFRKTKKFQAILAEEAEHDFNVALEFGYSPSKQKATDFFEEGCGDSESILENKKCCPTAKSLIACLRGEHAFYDDGLIADILVDKRKDLLTPKLLKVLVQQLPCYIEKIEQTPELCAIAVENYPYALKFVKKQTLKLCKLALKKTLFPDDILKLVKSSKIRKHLKAKIKYSF